MPTYQTAPLYNWTFPYQAIQRNKAGVGYFDDAPMRVEDTMGASGNVFDAHEKAVVLDRLRNNTSKMMGQLGLANTTERSQRADNHASLSFKKNGSFGDERTYGDGQQRGGTQYYFYSSEGQEYLKKLRERRIQELNAIESGNFGNAPQRVQVSPQTDEMDTMLSRVLDQFQVGTFPVSLVDDFGKLQTALIRIGATITSGKLNQYVDVFAKLQTQGERILANPGSSAGIYKLEAAAKKNLKSILLALKRLQRIAIDINKYIDQPQDVRQRALANLGFLGTTATEQEPFGNFVTQPASVAQTTPTGQQPAGQRPAGQQGQQAPDDIDI
jgi:hypothetical protein